MVRAGILSVSRGQTEAAYSLGLRPGRRLRLVVIPQAMRVIIPPLTSQYLNLTKNSTLAVAIGYPDLVQIFAGTVLNQTGQAVEVIVITMAVYLTISLVTSALMNLYNRRMALVERSMIPKSGTGSRQDHAQAQHERYRHATDATDGGPAFVRAKPLAPLPPPLTEAGAIGWLRQNLFSGRAQHRADHRLRRC